MEQLFRKVEFNEEIIHLLNGYVQNKWPLLLWQTDSRHSARYGVVTDFSIAQRQIVVSLSDLKHDLDLSKVIYCKGDEKKLTFKSLTHSDHGTSVALKIPDDIRLLESRKAPRYDMSTNKNAFMNISMKDANHSLKIIDISSNGCSVVMHASKLSVFHQGEVVKVTQIGSDQIRFPFTAIISHIKPIKGSGTVQLYKLGIAFSKEILLFNYSLTKNLER